MELKKVLIITYYWPPAGGGGVQRWVKFAKYLKEFGWEPIIFTADNAEYPILDESLAKDISKDTIVLKCPIVEPYSLYRKFLNKSKTEKVDANFLSQGKQYSFRDKMAVWIRGNFFIPDARFLWINPSIRFLTKYLETNRVDAIISTGPPHSCHLIALGIKSKLHIPWIVDYRDPWTQIDYFDDLRLTYFARKRHEYLEKKVLNFADVILTVGKTMAEDLTQISITKKMVITNGFDTEDLPLAHSELDKFFSITYIGTLNSSRNPLLLWKVLAKFKDEGHEIMNTIKVNLVGKIESVAIDSIDEYELSKWVNFVGYVSHNEAIKYQNKTQLLLLIINNTSNNKSILTGKIFEYIASSRPIISLGPIDGDAAEILRESQSGITIPYDDFDMLYQHLLVCFDHYKIGTLTATSINKDKYSRRSLTRELVTVLNDISAMTPK